MGIKKGFSSWEIVRGMVSSGRKNNRGQVWVETVIYTLIAFTLLSLVLTFVKPKIEEIQDKGIIEQSMNILEEVDSLVREIGTPGNQRILRMSISKGSMSFDGERDLVFFEIESKYPYSEPGEEISSGNIKIHTEERGDLYDVNLTMNYSGTYNITFKETEGLRKLSRASTPYKVSISNKGLDDNYDTIINFDVLT